MLLKTSKVLAKYKSIMHNNIIKGVLIKYANNLFIRFLLNENFIINKYIKTITKSIIIKYKIGIIFKKNNKQNKTINKMPSNIVVNLLYILLFFFLLSFAI